MKVKNQPVGTVECDRKACTEVCQVYRFRPRAEGRRTVFSGKHYFECPKHGRIGADGNPTVNEYILCNAKMSAPASTAGSPEKNPAPAKTPARVSSGGAPPASSSAAGTADAGNRAAPTAAARSDWRPLIDLE